MTTDRRRKQTVLLGICASIMLALTAGPTATQASEVNVGYFGKVAIEGYDPVAYFTDGKAVRGSEAFAYDWLGNAWHFSNDEHRKLFAANPISYAPQYGGHCADGVAYGELVVNIEPEVFKIIDGKLYLSGTAALGMEEGSDLMANAEGKWPELRADLLTQ